ncbi:hypothetical protein J2852_001131 [Azospirillum soli]|nr:hypothetical protein [Azospirillum soli]
MALFTEMYGFPLTIYLLSGWLQTRYPGLDLLSHDAGHLWSTIVGLEGNPHFNVLHILSNVLILAGFVLLAAAWKVLHAAQKQHRLATTGGLRPRPAPAVHRLPRHPVRLPAPVADHPDTGDVPAAGPHVRALGAIRGAGRSPGVRDRVRTLRHHHPRLGPPVRTAQRPRTEARRGGRCVRPGPGRPAVVAAVRPPLRRDTVQRPWRRAPEITRLEAEGPWHARPGPLRETHAGPSRSGPRRLRRAAEVFLAPPRRQGDAR